ncbi:MAG: hypothetical protein FWD77_01550 [Betaproteobacteria bacterium]|nr:hypothetical protein [Betaproteobacteria bacterium]
MIAYWDAWLNRWAQWKERERRGECGWYKVSPSFRNARSSGEYLRPGTPELDEQALFVDQCVQRLALTDLKTILAFYVWEKTAASAALKLGMSKRALYLRLDRIHQELRKHEQEFNDERRCD